VGVIGFLVLFLLFCTGMRIGFAMALVGLLGFAYLNTLEAALNVFVVDVWDLVSSETLAVIPCFILMGSVAFYSGISGRLFTVADKFLGHRTGGLAAATIAGCAAFAAVCGSTTASAATMGKVALPEMNRYGYDPSLATATVAAGGTLGIMIPPSTAFIVYGILTQQSIGKLFLAGIIPGIILSLLFIITIFVLCSMNPAIAPPGRRATWKERIRSTVGVVEMLLLFGLVMGGLFLGFFTPNEAGAIGAGGALILATIRGRLSRSGLVNALVDTAKITAMVFVILAGASMFGRFMAVSRITFELVNWVGSLPFSPHVIISLIILGYLIGGCFMDSLALVALTIPVLLPAVLKLGFDPIWFGVIMTLMGEAGVITPPVGVNVYVIQAVAPEVPLETIFHGVWPFVAAIIVCTVILMLFPQLATFLPSLMIG
jgi:tripartite ATP-independent transporter DctM subunit